MVEVPSKEEFEALTVKVTELAALEIQHESDLTQLKAAVAAIQPKPLPADVKAALNIITAWIATQ